MRLKRLENLVLALILVLGGWAGGAHGQGVTTASLTGRVTSAQGAPVAGATITAVHQPSGSRYTAVTRSDGRYLIPGMRVGGPYRVTASQLGLDTQTRNNVTLNLGVATDLDFTMAAAAVALEGITVTGQGAGAVFSSDRTGAATSVQREVVAALPTISGRLSDVTRLTPQVSASGGFAGQDPRLNNITVDGSYFNNSFGLGGNAEPGGRTDVAPISLAAVEQVQVNIAPFDVRQGNFVGAGINTVTRSGTNNFSGSLYHRLRDQRFVGTGAGEEVFDPGTFDYGLLGGTLAGPIIRNKLFFFVNYENENLTEPGTTFRANAGGEEVKGQVTRVMASDLDRLSQFLRTNFGYETGPYQGYEHGTPATRFLTRLDYNLNTNNKLSLRYVHLDSRTDVLASGSSSLGAGGRSRNPNALNFQNTNYAIREDIRSLVGEWNAVLGSRLSNNLILGYTFQDESRESRGEFFPLVDVLEAGRTYTSFGFEPFTPNNELRYGSVQFQNNLTLFTSGHTFTFGVSAERYESENVFFPGSQSVYVYNSLEDFYTDAQGYLANPKRTTATVAPRLFQVRYSNIPGQDKPIQPLEVLYTGLYGQDEWQPTADLKLTLGARVDAPFFGDTGFENPEVDLMTFRDENGNDVKYSTSDLPDANLLFSPRLGFNWDVGGTGNTQLRGGTGVFTGRPAYVWISNQIGENGVLTGFEQLSCTSSSSCRTRNRGFNPDPNAYKPTSVTGQPARSYGLAFTDPGFRFPQVWRNNIAIDQRLPFGLVATGEFIYGRDVNGVYYINANLPAAQTTLQGVDNRPRYTDNRRNDKVTSAIVLKNQNEGYSWNVSGTLERPFSNGLFAKVGYNYGVAKNTIDPGNIAFGSWVNNPHAGDPNNPGLGYSRNSPGHRIFGSMAYRAEYFRFGATNLSLFLDGFTGGNGSYVVNGDINGDGGRFNDLIYIPRDASEMNFVDFTDRRTGTKFTAAQQAAAFEAFIEQDRYLRENRGRYAERGAVFLPMVYRADLSVAQEVFRNIAGKRNGLEIRLDILNVGNLLNSDWGVGQRLVTNTPLVASGFDAQGKPRYTLLNIGDRLISESFQQTVDLPDVYRMQLGLRYTFQ